MKACSRYFLFLMLICFGYEVLAGPTLDKRELTLELEEVEGAISYQIEIRPVDRASLEKRYTFTSVKPKFKVALRPGHFEMRLRAADDRGAFGDWSETSPLSVAPKEVERLQPAAGSRFFERDMTEIDFIWGEAPGATDYRLVVMNESGSVVAERDFSTTHGKIALPAGHVYRWQVRSRYGKDLYSEVGEDSIWDFTFIGRGLASPQVTAHDLTGLRWKAREHARAVEIELSDVNVLNHERVLDKGTRSITGEARYTLQERVLYRAKLVATHPLMDSSEPRLLYFEKQNGALIVYGDQRPDDSERLASKDRRWYVALTRVSNSFDGSNVQYGQRTSFEGAGGVELKGGGMSQGQRFDQRFDFSYSAFGVTATSGSVDASLMQANVSWLWRKNLGLKKLPLNLHFGAGYYETPEFIANSAGTLALQYFRTLNWSLGAESSFAFSRRRSMRLGFALAFPLRALQAPGPIESMSRVDLHLRYYHDFKKLTGILGCEIHGTTIKYGGGTTMDFSSGGLSFGILY